ncbi:MAG TPA: DEAD/DEAH box helicase [Gammaproteobacteria bacterium]
MGDKHLTETRFSAFNLPQSLAQGIEEIGFSRCTPIQSETLPLALAGTDIAGQAQTGTGKTAAFLIAMMYHLLNDKPDSYADRHQPRGFILAPTRELAIQIHKDALAIGKYTGLNIGVVYGGEGYDTQREMIAAGIDILIGTPGRIIDYHKQHVYNLHAIKVLVLDEADRMFDLGFIKDIRFLLRRMPKPEKRLSMLFSATLSLRVTELAYEHMNNPQLIQIEPDKVTADKVTQSIYYAANQEKIPLLLGLLKKIDPKRTIIFINTKNSGNQLIRYLKANGFKADILSGDVPQKHRLKLLMLFQKGDLPLLVATDVAARGLHIPDVSHIINFDLPQDPEDYVHRIGRTARAGASGDAISFACEEFAFSLPDIEKYLGHKIPIRQITAELLVTPLPPSQDKPQHHQRHKSSPHKNFKRRGKSPVAKLR